MAHFWCLCIQTANHQGSLRSSRTGSQQYGRTMKSTEAGVHFIQIFHIGLIRLKSGCRAILSFKLFVKDDDKDQPWGDNIFSKITDFTISKIFNLNEPLCILLKHHYGYNSQSIYGSDKFLLDRLSQGGFKLDIQPVLIRLTGKGVGFMHYWERKKAYVKCSVHSLTEEALQLVRNEINAKKEKGGRFEKLDNKTSCFWFFGDDVGKGLWTSEIDDTAESLGNDAVLIRKLVCMFVTLQSSIHPNQSKAVQYSDLVGNGIKSHIGQTFLLCRLYITSSILSRLVYGKSEMALPYLSKRNQCANKTACLHVTRHISI